MDVLCADALFVMLNQAMSLVKYIALIKIFQFYFATNTCNNTYWDFPV